MYRLLLLNFVDSFIDNCILSCVDEPAYGGIVQCELLFGLAAHSGIYVGNGDISKFVDFNPNNDLASTPEIS